jgi:excinuclease UvrABC ATPase subunit
VGREWEELSRVGRHHHAEEAHRLHAETFSAFSRTRLPKASRPDCDSISGLAIPVAVSQSRGVAAQSNPRSTVGTAAEVSQLLRMLNSRCGSDDGLSAAEFSFNGPGACDLCQGLGRVSDLQLNLMMNTSLPLNSL